MAITRSNAAAVMEQDVVREIFKNATAKSAVMSLGRRLGGATSDTMKLRILDALPVAYWVDEENGGYKRETSVGWENKYITFEELALIVPIKQALLDDADIDIWAEIRPLIEEAFARAVDNAVLFGVNKPKNFDADVLSQAIAAGAVVPSTSNLYADIDNAMAKVEASGYDPSGILGSVKLKSAFRNLLDSTGQPIANTEIGALPRQFVKNGAWDDTKTKMLIGDFNNLVYAVREDVTYKLLDQAVIQDPATKEIVYNLAQQDMVALRVFCRFGWALPNPVTSIDDSDSRFPFAVISVGSLSGDKITITVSDADGAIKGASVTLGGKIVKTNASGQAVFEYASGTYQYIVKYGDYAPATGSLTVNGTTAKAITLA